jgi:hypothetical protein
VYFEFQFDDVGIKRDLGSAVHTLHRDFEDVEIADWLARPNPVLNHLTPLRWSASGRNGQRLTEAAMRSGPVRD